MDSTPEGGECTERATKASGTAPTRGGTVGRGVEVKTTRGV